MGTLLHYRKLTETKRNLFPIVAGKLWSIPAFLYYRHQYCAMISSRKAQITTSTHCNTIRRILNCQKKVKKYNRKLRHWAKPATFAPLFETWRFHLAVRIPASHAGYTGSSPVGATQENTGGLRDFLFLFRWSFDNSDAMHQEQIQHSLLLIIYFSNQHDPGYH